MAVWDSFEDESSYNQHKTQSAVSIRLMSHDICDARTFDKTQHIIDPHLGCTSVDIALISENLHCSPRTKLVK